MYACRNREADRLKHDSGYTLWEASDIPDPQARLGSVMQRAFERYAALPEAERVYRPDEAIKSLAHYAGISMAIGSSRLEPEISRYLPELLEPFAPLSPVVHTIWLNSIATRDVSCNLRPERALARWKEVYEKLRELDATDPKFVGVFRRAVAHAIGSNEASLGLASAESWAGILDGDLVQRVSALNLRRVVRIQHGDWEGAEVLRRRVETLRLQTRARQMFNTLVPVEMVACSLAGDLTGLQQMREQIAALATRSPGWMPMVHFAEGLMQLLCVSYDAALQSFERAMGLAMAEGDRTYPIPMYAAALIAARLEALVGLDRIAEARARGEAALTWCQEREIDLPAHAIARAVALAEAKAGAVDAAAARLDAVIARQCAFGVTGLHLGASYEARARVSIYAGDKAGIERFAALTASEYRHGHNSPLGARYERLMREARRAVQTRLPELTDFQSIESRVTEAERSDGQRSGYSLDDLEVTGDLE